MFPDVGHMKQELLQVNKLMKYYYFIIQAIPSNDIYYDNYSPDYLLHFPIRQNVENRNKTEDLNRIVATVYDYLSHIENAPGIHFHDVPFSFYPDMD